jgi:hypothetical protein
LQLPPEVVDVLAQARLFHVFVSRFMDTNQHRLGLHKQGLSESNYGFENLADPLRKAEHDQLNPRPELGDSFWDAAGYCGFLRYCLEPGTTRRTSMFMNEAYARLAGTNTEELTTRLSNTKFFSAIS